MKQEISPRFWVILGIGTAVVVGLVLSLALLGRGGTGPLPPMITPVIPSLTPVAQSPIGTPSTSPLAGPTIASPLPSPVPSPTAVPPTRTLRPTPDPTPAAAVPEVAPDFTLKRSGGGTFTLSEQLAEGPVVLVFFQRGGG